MRFTKTLAAAAAALALGSAQAVVISIDDFNTVTNPPPPFGPGQGVIIWDQNDLGFGGTSANGLGTTPGNIATHRDMFHLLTAGSTGFNGNSSSLGIGPAPNFVANALNALNGSQANAVSVITWTLDTAALGAAIAGNPVVNLFFSVVESNLGIVANAAVNNRLDFELETVAGSGVFNSFETIFIGQVTTPTNLTFALSAAQSTALQSGNRLRMTISGAPAYDLTLDSFGFSIPEPSTFALAGLALLGAGIAARRRKA